MAIVKPRPESHRENVATSETEDVQTKNHFSQRTEKEGLRDMVPGDNSRILPKVGGINAEENTRSDQKYGLSDSLLTVFHYQIGHLLFSLEYYR